MAQRIIENERILTTSGESTQYQYRIVAVIDNGGAVADNTDLTALGTDFAPGSIAIAPTDDSTDVYILNASHEWKKKV